VIVLPVVLPETLSANLVSPSFLEGEISTTRAGEPDTRLSTSNYRVRRELVDVVLEPLLARG